MKTVYIVLREDIQSGLTVIVRIFDTREKANRFKIKYDDTDEMWIVERKVY